MSDYAERPFILIWEITQACPLVCSHCRADARPFRDPGELSTAEARRLLDEAAELDVFVVVLSGGDPLAREDLYDLVRHGVERGLRMSTIPAASEQLTRDVVRRLAAAGLSQMALSLDGPDAAIHDAFRGTPGAFDRTLEAARWAHREELPLQINSVLSRTTWPRFAEMRQLVESLDPVFWEIFFLVPTGRAQAAENLDPEEYEAAFAEIRACAAEVPFLVKVVEAPHYHRYCLQQGRDGGPRGRAASGLGRRAHHPGAVGRAPAPVNAGKGFCFVSHRGEVFPSGFLPVSAGNVRRTPLARIYRDSGLFRALRDPDRLQGKCGACEYRAVCGGSRSRALALTGNVFASDPSCAYEPGSEDGQAREAHAGRQARRGHGAARAAPEPPSA